MPSRQREYQKRHALVGLCMQCAAPALRGRERCLRHHIFYMLRKRGLAKGVLSVRENHKREKLAASWSGRYHAIVGGWLQPGLAEDNMRSAQEIRQRLGIKWGGLGGVSKMSTILASLDRHALRERKVRALGTTV